jgi:hypothetical protein
VAAALLNIGLMQVLGISLAAMAAFSVAIFEFAVRGGVTVSTEGEHFKAFKGEEYETVLTIESRATDWIGSTLPTVSLETGRLIKAESLEGGRVRLLFLGTYAGRSDGVDIGISITDPLRLLKKLDHVVHSELVVDTLPRSLLAPGIPRRLTIFGFGDQPTGYPGPGQELYGLDEYHSGDTKDIIWKRVAKSPEEALVARVREASVRDVVRVGVVRFAERGDARAAWVDLLCEALGQIGMEVFEMGATLTILYHSQRVGAQGRPEGADDRPPGLTEARARDPVELAEAVMACSAAKGSREIERVLSSADFVITGLKEINDEKMATRLAEKPILLISEETAPSSTFAASSVIYSGKENLFPLVRNVLER